MNCLAFAVFFVAASVATAGYLPYAPVPVALVGPPAKGAVLKGPSAKATIVGPDGSAISAAADSGAVVAAPKPGGIITAAVEPGYVAKAAPVLAPVVAPLPVAPAPIVKTGTLIAGPSGKIETSGPAKGLIAAPILAEPVVPAYEPIAPVAKIVAPAYYAPAPAYDYGYGYYGKYY